MYDTGHTPFVCGQFYTKGAHMHLMIPACSEENEAEAPVFSEQQIGVGNTLESFNQIQNGGFVQFLSILIRHNSHIFFAPLHQLN